MKYTVNVKEVHNLAVDVEANSPEEAKELVENMIAESNENIDFDNLSYSHTQNKSTWDVKEKE